MDAVLYWMARMLDGGEDPLVIVRRMVAMASEDIGLADNQALVLALAAKDAVDFLGVPEGELAMVHAAIYLATAPKSNSVKTALTASRESAQATPSVPVPLHLRNAPTAMMKALDYGKDYKYPHDDPAGFASSYLPDELKSSRFYEPREIGDERETAKRLAYWRRLRRTDPGPTPPHSAAGQDRD